MDKVWITGTINPENYKEWLTQGIFETKEQALAACRTENDFIGSMPFNIAAPSTEPEVFDEAEYPLR